MEGRSPELQSIGVELGAGARGIVFQCRIDGEDAAIKIFLKKKHFDHERDAYEQLSRCGLDGQLSPQYLGAIPLSPAHLYQATTHFPCFLPNPGLYEVSPGLGPHPVGIGMSLLTGMSLHQVLLKDIGDVQRTLIENALRSKFGILHDVAGICHNDPSRGNIILDDPLDVHTATEILPHQVHIIDFSEALLKLSCSEEDFKTGCHNDIRKLELTIEVESSSAASSSEESSSIELRGELLVEELGMEELLIQGMDANDMCADDSSAEDSSIEDPQDERMEVDYLMGKVAEHSYMSDEDGW